MPERTLSERVEILEKTVSNLETVPARMARVESRLEGVEVRVSSVASQIVQLRDEMHVEFSTLRTEVRAGDEAVRTDLRAEMIARFAQTHDLIREGDEETRRYMCMLHEDVIAKISTIGEGRRPGRKRKA